MSQQPTGALALFDVADNPQPRSPHGQIDTRAGWAMEALSAIEAMARTGREFQAIDVAEQFKLAEPAHHSAWGRAFSEAHRRGVIVRIGAIQSRRRTVHRSLCVLWRGAPEWACQAAAA